MRRHGIRDRPLRWWRKWSHGWTRTARVSSGTVARVRTRGTWGSGSVYSFVADGMGSDRGGHAGSRVVDTLVDFYQRAGLHGTDRGAAEARMALAYRQAHLDVIRVGQRRWGATAAALRFENEHAVIGHVGDCRIYRVRGPHLEALTRDHSVGDPTGDGKRGRTLTRALGMGEEAPAAIRTIRVQRGDRFLVCTDGLIESVSEHVIHASLTDGSSKDAVRELIGRAKQTTQDANLSAIVVTAA